MIDFTDISVAIIRRTFRSRFKLASLTERSVIFRNLVRRLFLRGTIYRSYQGTHPSR
ncbi:hypothetical protein ACRERI_03465 [Methanothermobacter thermautotrophicus]|uniref:hypothetical protein n=1 Tax=Methanothermobacter thermautotrophicus TaxID=145262 RepID=UPI003D7F4352